MGFNVIYNSPHQLDDKGSAPHKERLERKDEKLEKPPQYHHQGKFVKLHQVYSTKSHTTNYLAVASQSG